MLAEQPFLIAETPWVEVRDGNRTALSIFDRHYSSTRAHVRKQDQFVGPGEKMVLLTPCARALFVWRRFIDDCVDARTGQHQAGINCAVFRNESQGGGRLQSSNLILAADEIAFAEWPGERHYTYVDPEEIRSTNPGFCFICAGWRPCGYTKSGLRILELLP